jgi:endonuclease/exonuclease/phosphatase family metal-dependent hydrolase
MGVRGFTTTTWDDETLNCEDASRPLNAWGHGLPQRELARLRDDPAIVALGLQEAWNCASPERVNGILGFATASMEVEGVALLARHGFRGPVQYTRINAEENRWVVGGDVCLDEACATTVPVYSTHWGAPPDEFPLQARATVELLGRQPRPHVLVGDLNVYEIDRWSPWAPCAAATTRSAALDIVRRAGYRDAWPSTQIGAGWTGMASRPECGHPQGGPFKRIDYVFTRGLDAIATAQFARAAPGGDAPSDHIGLIAELAFPRP